MEKRDDVGHELLAEARHRLAAARKLRRVLDEHAPRRLVRCTTSGGVMHGGGAHKLVRDSAAAAAAGAHCLARS